VEQRELRKKGREKNKLNGVRWERPDIKINNYNTIHNFKTPTNALYYQVLLNIPYICFSSRG
jgi:hypothetical protein